jgi:hypothetical protein
MDDSRKTYKIHQANVHPKQLKGRPKLDGKMGTVVWRQVVQGSNG